MKKNFYKILCLATLAFSLILFAQEKTHIIKLKPLHGVTETTNFPKFTFKGYVDGSLQKGLEQYSNDNFGFREWAIRLYNQFCWTCFHKTFTYVMIGKEGYLYEPFFVQDYYESLMYSYANNNEDLLQKFNIEAKRLYKVQEILKDYDVSLFVACLPGKERIYPEYLPENKWYHHSPKGIVAIEAYPKIFDSIGVNYVNISSWFEQMKDTFNYPLFTQNGTHWSNLSVTYASDSLIRYMEFISKKNIKNIQIGKPYPAKTRVPDNDLEDLFNLMFPMKNRQNYYADVSVIPDSTATKPNFIDIGDSFFWNISFMIPLDKIFSHTYYWYYNSTIYFDNDYTSTKDINLAEQLIKSDIVMLSYCSVQLYKLGNDFSAHALVHLCYDDDQINAKMNEIISNIRNSKENFDKLQSEASKKGKSIDNELIFEADSLLYANPEKYFNELASDYIPTVRNKNLASYYEEHKSTSPRLMRIKEIKENMLKSPEWMKNLKEKAKKANKSLEEIMDMDAIWVYEQENK